MLVLVHLFEPRADSKMRCWLVYAAQRKFIYWKLKSVYISTPDWFDTLLCLTCVIIRQYAVHKKSWKLNMEKHSFEYYETRNDDVPCCLPLGLYLNTQNRALYLMSLWPGHIHSHVVFAHLGWNIFQLIAISGYPCKIAPCGLENVGSVTWLGMVSKVRQGRNRINVILIPFITFAATLNATVSYTCTMQCTL